jgi:hypothetical protein
MERQRWVEACKRDRSWAQRVAVLETMVVAWVGSMEVARERAAAVGTMTTGRTQDKGFRWGSMVAIDGIPGSTDSQVEQTLERGWALRPESERATEVVKERTGAAKEGRELAVEMRGGTVVTSGAGQLVKAIRSTKASMGSV